MQRFLLCVLLAVGFCGGAAAQPEQGAKSWWDKYLSGSRLVDLPGGRRLNLYCEGSGTPVVVMESGLSTGAWSWRKVQPGLARTTRTCVYDRAGYWLSPPTDGPRDAGTEADDLAALLKAAQLPAPYVVVGQSYGGYIARLYASRHAQDLAGLVLVDPSTEHQDKRLNAVVPHLVALDLAAEDKIRSCAADPRPRIEAKDCIRWAAPADLPANLKDWFVAGQTAAYDSAMDREYQAMGTISSDALVAERKSIGSVSFVLLHGGKPVTMPGEPQDEMAAFETVWLQMHRETLDLSRDSELRIVQDASHNIQEDDPAAVLQAVADVVAKARASQKR